MKIKEIYESKFDIFQREADLEKRERQTSFKQIQMREAKLRDRFIKIAFNHAARDKEGIARSMALDIPYSVGLDGHPPAKTFLGQIFNELLFNPNSSWPISDFSQGEIDESESYKRFVEFLDSEGLEVQHVFFHLNQPSLSPLSSRSRSQVSFHLDFKR